MLQVLNTMLIAIFLILSIFFGFFSYSQHCDLFSYFNFDQCPPHWFFVYVLGLGSFALALFIRCGTAGFLEFIIKLLKTFIQKLKKQD